MSDKTFKAPRPIAEIQQEYQGICLKAGHLQYSIVTLQKDLDLVNATLRDLNIEASASQAQAAAEAQAKPAVDPTVAEAPKVEEEANNPPKPKKLRALKSEEKANG